MSKETKEQLKTILANTQAIMKHLGLESNRSNSDKKSTKAPEIKKKSSKKAAPAKKSKSSKE